jgi:cytochrome c-type biogenesis protein CcmH/NrfF
MDRRTWLEAMPALLAGGSLAAQSRQDPGAADPLPNPGWVGRPRDVVDSADNMPAVDRVEHRLHCTCGCGLDVFTCRTTDFTCGVSPALHREVLDLLAAGRTPDQVVDAFVAKYGERILMTPRDRGFSALGYRLPAGLLALGGAILAWVLVRRSRRSAALRPDSPAAPAPDLSGDELARLDRALRDLPR